jgi:hypothetical protein
MDAMCEKMTIARDGIFHIPVQILSCPLTSLGVSRQPQRDVFRGRTYVTLAF